MTEPPADLGPWLDAQLGGRALPPLLILVGLGDGHVLDIVHARSPSTRILALEPNADTAAALLASGATQSWLERGRLTCLIGPDYAGAENAWRLVPQTAGGFQLLVHPALVQHADPATAAALQVVKRILNGARANADARRKLGPAFLANVLHNLPAIASGSDLHGLSGVYPNIPAVIAAAGPSLDTAIPQLAALDGRAVFIAVDTALRPLLNHGLAPHFVTGLDPSALNARHFAALPECPQTWLLAESALDPNVVRRFAGRTFWFRVSTHHPWPWLNELGVDVGLVEVWGSVLTAAFQAALLMGCDPIVIVGADLSYTRHHPYCRGTTYELDSALLVARGADAASIWEPWMLRHVMAPDVRGAEIATTPSLIQFRDWMVSRIGQSGRRVVNAAGEGLLHGPKIEQASLAAAVGEGARVVSPGQFVRRPTTLTSGRLATRVREVRRTVTSTPPAGSPAQRWRDFLGEGWNPSAVAHALKGASAALDAAEALATRGPGRADPGPPPAVAAVHPLIPRLPEAIERWRRARAGEALPAVEEILSATGTTPEGLLVDALDILRRLCAVMRIEGSPPPDVAALWTARAPLATAAAWSETTRWAVLLFEGLLGAACRHPLVVEDSPFLSRPVCPRDSAAPMMAEPPPPAATAPQWHQACALLAAEWLMASRSVLAAGDDLPQASARLQQYGALLTGGGAGDSPASLRLAIDRADGTAVADLPVPVTSAALVRVLTGTLAPARAATIADGHADPAEWPGALAPYAPALVQARAGSAVLGRLVDTARPRAGRLLAPRVLTDEGVPGANLAYAVAGGVACVSPYARESFVLREDGAWHAFHQWPWPIVGELPLGDGGAVAWNHVGRDSRAETAYVMYRERPEAVPRIDALPFRPNHGAWWDDGVVFTCTPSGIARWSPDTPAALLAEGLAASGIYTGEEGLMLEPCSRAADGSRLRVRARDMWRWEKGGAVAVAAGRDGAVSSHSAGPSGWTALACPEADAILLHRHGRPAARMTCYCPFKVAWLGDSLLVSTLTRELLLFERLASVLGADGEA